MFSSAAYAQAYVSGAAGVGHISLNCGSVPCDETGTAFKVLSGYKFGSGVAGELGYIAFGKATASNSKISTEAKAGGLLIGAEFHAPLAHNFGLIGRLGIINMKLEGKYWLNGVGADADSETNIKPYVGFAVTYAFSQNVNVEASADFSRAEYGGDETSVRAFTAGLRFDF